MTQPHYRADRKELFQRISGARTKRLGGSSNDLQQQLLQKTLSLWSSFRRLGCQAPPFEATYFDKSEQERLEQWNEQMDRKRRGHEPKKTCDGRLLFEYDHKGKAFVRCVVLSICFTNSNLQAACRSCEHYHHKGTADHLINFDVGSGLYDTDYLEALFLGNNEEVCRLEEEAYFESPSSMSACSTVTNSSSIRVHCRAYIIVFFSLL